MGKYTTLGIGGMAKWLTEAETETELGRAVEWAEKNKVEWTVIGAGSNLLVSDQGYSGLIIVNKTAGSGMMLNDLVDQMNSRGLAGMECLAGIPGSVGGAVYGNAGAYGQTISDYLVGMKTLNKFWLKSECNFGYRESIFKKNREIILEVEFDLPKGDRDVLVAESDKIRELRKRKYPPGMKCPGSFFKNLFFEQLPEMARRQIPSDKIKEGKVAAGYLLEMMGARGMRLGGAQVADYHGNLIFNTDGAKASEVWGLAQKLQALVRNEFGVMLEPEVQLVGRFRRRG